MPTDQIYGFPCGENPNDFRPDVEVCTEAEIAAHAEACRQWDAGEYKRDPHQFCESFDLKPGESGVVHISRTPWGMGVSTVEFEDEEAVDD